MPRELKTRVDCSWVNALIAEVKLLLYLSFVPRKARARSLLVKLEAGPGGPSLTPEAVLV